MIAGQTLSLTFQSIAVVLLKNQSRACAIIAVYVNSNRTIRE